MVIRVDQTAFWRQRILSTVATGRQLHQIIFDTDLNTWRDIHDHCAALLPEYIRPGDRVLDAGCGYGALCCVLQQCELLEYIYYTGVDISPDLIDIARVRYIGDNEKGPFSLTKRYPNLKLEVGDLTSLSYQDDSFDWVICRSIKDMVTDYIGKELWSAMRKELLRVGSKILLLEYTSPDKTIIETREVSSVNPSST